MLISLCSSEYHWTILMNVWRLVFSMAEQEGNVPWSCFQPVFLSYPSVRWTDFLDHDAPLGHQLLSVRTPLWAQVPMRNTGWKSSSLSKKSIHRWKITAKNCESQVLEYFWMPETEWTSGCMQILILLLRGWWKQPSHGERFTGRRFLRWSWRYNGY